MMVWRRRNGSIEDEAEELVHVERDWNVCVATGVEVLSQEVGERRDDARVRGRPDELGRHDGRLLE